MSKSHVYEEKKKQCGPCLFRHPHCFEPIKANSQKKNNFSDQNDQTNQVDQND